MDQHTAAVPAAIKHVIDSIRMPALRGDDDTPKPPQTARRARLHRTLSLNEKEEALNRESAALAARSAELQRKEESLSERWDAGRIHELSPSDIAPNPSQPRREFEDLSLFSLANSIREHGILQPLTVRRMPSSGTHPEVQESTFAPPFQLIAGERRLRAAVMIGMTHVPCIILDADNRRAAELALIENLQRENLNPFEQAGAIAALIDMHAMTQEEIARSLSVSQSCIANKLRILRLTGEEREIILSAHLTERHARAVLRIHDLAKRRAAVRSIAERGLNVAQTEQYIDALLSVPMPSLPADRETPPPNPSSSDTADTHRQNRRCVLRDLRLFFNTVERAAAVVREAGYETESTRTETDDGVILTVTLRRPPSTYPSESTAIVSRETD